MILLAGAGLLIASFANMRAVDPGFARQGLITARVVLQRGTSENPLGRRIWIGKYAGKPGRGG